MSASTHRIAELAALVADVQAHASRDIDTTLAEITDSATRSVPGVQHAGLTVVGGEREVRSVAATSEFVVALDEAQGRLGEGPCLSAAWDNDVIRVDDLETDGRWPRYGAEAVATTPIRSVLSIRVYGDKHESAALNLFAERAGALTQDTIDMGMIFATHTALAWSILRRDAQFRSALASRDVIGQAKGMLMERFEIDALQAFELLKRLSQEGNTPLHLVAERLVRSAGEQSARTRQTTATVVAPTTRDESVQHGG